MNPTNVPASSIPVCTPTSTAAFPPVNWLGGITSCTSAFTFAQDIAEPVPVISVIKYKCQISSCPRHAMYAIPSTANPRARSSNTPRYRRSRRSISTPPRNGTTRPGRVTTITCQLTATVECVADMMYQLTPMKFIPLPNSDTNMAVKKKRKERCSHSNPQSTRCVVAVAIEPTSLLSDCCPSMKRETEILGREQVAAGSPGRQPSISSKCPQTEDGRCVFPINSSACQGLRGAHGEAIESFAEFTAFGDKF